MMIKGRTTVNLLIRHRVQISDVTKWEASVEAYWLTAAEADKVPASHRLEVDHPHDISKSLALCKNSD